MPVALRMAPWPRFVERWKDCQLCPLGEQRDRIVLARGSLPCDVLFIGEAPGDSENALGQPFKGPAGKKLDKIIERSVPPEVTYALTNLVCCYPRDAKMSDSDNHQPSPDEIRACRPRLYEFINIAQPRLIVCVGALATAWVPHDNGVPCVDIIHPASTFPPRMPLAQANMALDNCAVIVRRAVSDMLESGRRNFTNWRHDHAGQSFDALHGAVPF